MQNTKFPNANWDQYSSKIISALSLKKTAIGEYHGACPVCQGVDRFWIKEDAQNCVMVSCRKCSDFAGIKDALRNQNLWTKIQSMRVFSKRALDLIRIIHK